MVVVKVESLAETRAVKAEVVMALEEPLLLSLSLLPPLVWVAVEEAPAPDPVIVIEEPEPAFARTELPPALPLGQELPLRATGM